MKHEDISRLEHGLLLLHQTAWQLEPMSKVAECIQLALDAVQVVKKALGDTDETRNAIVDAFLNQLATNNGQDNQFAPELQPFAARLRELARSNKDRKGWLEHIRETAIRNAGKAVKQ